MDCIIFLVICLMKMLLTRISLMTKGSSSQCMLWHMKMGHPSFKVLKQLFVVNKDADMLLHNECPMCPLAKQTRIPFPVSVSRASFPFDLLHLDVWGPYRHFTHNGFRFFLTIVDDN